MAFEYTAFEYTTKIENLEHALDEARMETTYALFALHCIAWEDIGPAWADENFPKFGERWDGKIMPRRW